MTVCALRINWFDLKSMLLIKLLFVSGNAYPGGIVFRCLSIKIQKIK